MPILLLAGVPLLFAEDLSVSSNVRGASISINGEETGFRTPAVISGLHPGHVDVEVYDQCRRGRAGAEIVSGQANRITVDAQDELAQLTVEVSPPQAVVDVNNGKVKLSPNVPVGLACGTYEIKAELRGYSSASYTLELSGGQELTLPIELDRLGVSTVEVSVKPSTGTILFDGKEVGHDAASLPSVYEGEHTIGASLKGYTTVEAMIVVGDGDDLVFGIELARGDRDSSVTGVGGAGRAALSEGAARKMAAAPSTPAPTTTPKTASKVVEPEIVDIPEDEPEPEPVKPTKVVEPEVVADMPEEDEPTDEVDNLDEVPDEVAEPKSWSELHAEEPKATAKPEKSTKVASSSSKSTATKTTGKSKVGQHVAGGVLMGLGAVVAGGGGYYTYAQAAETYNIYTGKQAAADDADGQGKERLQEQADTYYTSEFEPKANLMYGAFTAGGVLAATGLLLLIIDSEGPIVLPTPDGGAIVSWSASF